MEEIYSRFDSSLLLHVINKFGNIDGKRQNLGPEKESLQVACLSLNKGMEINSHKHLEQTRTTEITQESWLVVKGSIKIKLYDTDDSLIKEEILNSGDCLVTFRGGHGFIALDEGTCVYEFKTGPYLGKEKDNAKI